MFRGGQPNPYDDIVAKTTDENLTSENWELIITLCDKVQEEGEQGARNVIAAILKRLTHRTSNVQLYTLTLAESLTKNCGIEVHREIASRAFTQGLEKLIQDRNTHEKVRKRALSLIAEWAADWEKDPTLGIMEECYTNLKSKGYRFDSSNEPPPPEQDDVLRRQEEEELQRVLEMSMHDKGGRGQWNQYSLASSGAGGSGSSLNQPPTSSSRTQPQQQTSPVYGGYVPSSSPALPSGNTSASVAAAAAAPAPAASTYVPSSPVPSVKSTDSIPVVTRVRALHTFEPTEAGELAFEKGDIIKVVDRGYKDWWRGQLKGRTGIFPVNYVEPLPEPTAAELAKEAEQEAAVFAQAANVDRLLQMLRQMDPAKDNLADNEEIQELYRSCMSVRPKIVKLIDKYSQKRADLVSMNETFVKARSIFDRMMEDSLARNSSGYDLRSGYGQPPYPRQEVGVPGYGWNPSGYEQGAYGGYPAQGPYPPPEPYPPQQPYVDPAAYQQPPVASAYPPQPYGQPVGPAPQPYIPPAPQSQPQPTPQLQPYGQTPIPVQGVSPVPISGPTPAPQVQQVQSPVEQQAIQPQYQLPTQPQVQTQPQTQPTFQPQVQVQAQPIQQQSPVAAQPEVQPQVQQQNQPQPQQLPQQAQPQPQQSQSPPQQGPPYVYDPNATYPDPNVQAWAQYYAQGGTDPTGALYFISVPGVKEAAPVSPLAQNQPEQGLAASTAPLNIHRDDQQAAAPAVNNVAYGASPYAAVGAASPVQDHGAGLASQFAGLNVGAAGPQAGQPQAAGAPA